ncbi:MAG: diaminopimelate epimerase [Pseudomonadota bacterium]
MLNFTKMQSIGNDFVVIDNRDGTFEPEAARIRRLCDRHFGIGCDQLLLVENADEADFHYRIFNADGGEVNQCGNGARCFARYVHERGLSDANPLRVATRAGQMVLELTDDGLVRVDMGVPVLEPAAIPFEAEAATPQYELEVEGRTFRIGAVGLGNPHAVLRVDDLERAPVALLGPAIEHHPRFPERANVGFMAVDDRDRIRLRVFERGAGETLACGSGACAAVVSGRQQGWLDDTVTVTLPGGSLMVEWPGEGTSVQLVGPAETVFKGSTEL